VNRNNLIALFTFGVVMLALGLLWFIDRDERLIRKRLDDLAENVSMTKSTPIGTAKAAKAFDTFFTDPVTIHTNYDEIDGNHTREELRNLFLLGRTASTSIHLHFDTPEFISCKNRQAQLRTHAILTIHVKDAESGQEQRNLIINLEKFSGKWLIRKITDSSYN
jgi:hypothetical protein